MGNTSVGHYWAPGKKKKKTVRGVETHRLFGLASFGLVLLHINHCKLLIQNMDVPVV